MIGLNCKKISTKNRVDYRTSRNLSTTGGERIKSHLILSFCRELIKVENPNAKIGVLLFLCVIKTWTPCSQIDILDSTCHSCIAGFKDSIDRDRSRHKHDVFRQYRGSRSLRSFV